MIRLHATPRREREIRTINAFVLRRYPVDFWTRANRFQQFHLYPTWRRCSMPLKADIQKSVLVTCRRTFDVKNLNT